MIRERDAEGRFEEAYVFDRWCHVGTARSEDELADLSQARFEIDFDPDIYQIVRSFTSKHPARVKVVPARRVTEDAAADLLPS